MRQGEIDIVSLYLDEAGKHELLSPEEERELGYRIQAGDEAAFHELVTKNLRFVVMAAKQWGNRKVPLEDLIQEGNLGLMEAALKFDPSSGTRFLSYAVYWVKRGLQDALQGADDVRKSWGAHWRLMRVRREKAKLNQRLGRDPSIEELAAASDMEVEQVKFLLDIDVPTQSLDAPVTDSWDGSLALGDVIADEGALEVEIEHDQGLEMLADALSTLHARDAQVLKLRYGLGGGRTHSFEEIGQIFGFTRERARQLHNRGVAMLREHPDIEAIAELLFD